MADAVTIMGFMIALVFALCVHEWAHAYAAFLQGDHTAEDEGRLTLNPIAHIDPFGTIIFPLLAIMSGFSFLFGWAKPVPVNPANFKNIKYGHAIVAFAGPFSNLVLTAISAFLLVIYYAFWPDLIDSASPFYPFLSLLKSFAIINAVLAFFNLLPIPPLDGGAIIQPFLPMGAKHFFEDYIEPYGSFILLALLIGGGLSWVGFLAQSYYHTVLMVFAGIFS